MAVAPDLAAVSAVERRTTLDGAGTPLDDTGTSLDGGGTSLDGTGADSVDFNAARDNSTDPNNLTADGTIVGTLIGSIITAAVLEPMAFRTAERSSGCTRTKPGTFGS